MFRRLFYTLILAAFLVSMMGIGCAPVTVQQTMLKQTYTDVRADVVTTGELSQMTQPVLRMPGLQGAAQEPQRAFHDLDVRSARQPDDAQQVALAEMVLLNAMHNDSSNPTTTADWYGLAASGPSLNGTRRKTALKTAPTAGRPPQLMRIAQSCDVLASSSEFCSSA